MIFSIPRPDTGSAWYPFVDANPERSPRDIGEHCGLTHAAVSRRLRGVSRTSSSRRTKMSGQDYMGICFPCKLRDFSSL
jgi:hypothetical protein